MSISTQVFVRVAQNKTKKKKTTMKEKESYQEKKKVEDVEHDFFSLPSIHLFSPITLYKKTYVSRRNRFYSVDTKTSTSEVLSICIQMIHMEQMMDCQRTVQNLNLLTEEDQDIEIPHWTIRPTCSCMSVISLLYSLLIFFILVF